MGRKMKAKTFNGLVFRVSVAALVLVIFFSSLGDGTEFSIKRRVKRKVLFTKSSKFFFRLNGKENILNYTTLLAHGWGFRINYDLPSSLNQRLRFFKRDIHSNIDNIENPLFSNMVNCILKRVCLIASQPFIAENCGVFCGIGKIIARSQGIEADFFKTFGEKCHLYQERCSASLEKSSIFNLILWKSSELQSIDKWQELRPVVRRFSCQCPEDNCREIILL